MSMPPVHGSATLYISQQYSAHTLGMNHVFLAGSSIYIRPEIVALLAKQLSGRKQKEVLFRFRCALHLHVIHSVSK